MPYTLTVRFLKAHFFKPGKIPGIFVSLYEIFFDSPINLDFHFAATGLLGLTVQSG